jgi:DNA topoisomerase I
VEKKLLNQLIHQGVLIPAPPDYRGVIIRVKNQDVNLNPKQEEIAIAWAKKQGTPYVEDSVFVRNFMIDFSRALGYIDSILSIADVDFTAVNEIVAAEREAKAQLTKEQRKELAAARKLYREQQKEKYGFAIADGVRIELANYLVEPSGIFMGRGKHPLRGRWKEGATYQDITLNLSPDAPRPEGQWAEIIWQPESLWVAKWMDKLSDKFKYIWLHDTAPVKQAREAEKFDKAIELEAVIDKIRDHIQKGMIHENPKRRRIATACYLIDALCLRVGDEKDPDEADTVGATTLRPEHLKFHPDGVVEFKFLGKDSVLWHKKLNPPPLVLESLKDVSLNAKPSISDKSKKKHPVYSKPQLFPDVSSRNVNDFLSEVMPGLTAKVFRTNHATSAVRKSLESATVKPSDPEHRKWEAVVRANIEAAILCNHTKQPPKNWAQRKEKFKDREKKTRERLIQLKEKISALESKIKILKQDHKIKMSKSQKKSQEREKYKKQIQNMLSNLDRLKASLVKTDTILGKLKAQKIIASENRTWNLTTSQKSYIDPRVFYQWGLEVEYDVLAKYYSTTLQRKFLWVRNSEEPEVDE